MSLVPFDHLKKREPNLYSLGRVFFKAPIGKNLKQFVCFSIDAEIESPLLTPSSFLKPFAFGLALGVKTRDREGQERLSHAAKPLDKHHHDQDDCFHFNQTIIHHPSSIIHDA